jgi:hypothetical protein
MMKISKWNGRTGSGDKEGEPQGRYFMKHGILTFKGDISSIKFEISPPQLIYLLLRFGFPREYVIYFNFITFLVSEQDFS